MARNIGTALQNNLSKGLITEATGLNFPANAVTETWNTVFEKMGSVTRRKGIDIESEAETLSYAVSDGVVREFIWQSVAETGGFTFLVVQMGTSVVFFELTLNSSLSAGVMPVGVDLDDYKAPGAGDLRTIPCTFAAGSGYLFITNPGTDPIVVRYNTEDDEFQTSRVRVYIRDFAGLEDDLALEEEPSSLSVEHNYNLKNQGWYKPVRVGAKSTGGSSSSGGLGSFNSSSLDWLS